jgi:hypothetical protein
MSNYKPIEFKVRYRHDSSRVARKMLLFENLLNFCGCFEGLGGDFQDYGSDHVLVFMPLPPNFV